MRALTFKGVQVDPQGRIVSYVTLPREDFGANARALPDGWKLIPGFDSLSGEEWFFPSGRQPARRPVLIEAPDVDLRADGEDVFRLSVDPATYLALRVRDERGRWRHDPLDVSDGTFEFVTAVPGLYEFDIEPPFPIRPVRLRITAHAV